MSSKTVSQIKLYIREKKPINQIFLIEKNLKNLLDNSEKAEQEARHELTNISKQAFQVKNRLEPFHLNFHLFIFFFNFY